MEIIDIYIYSQSGLKDQWLEAISWLQATLQPGKLLYSTCKCIGITLICDDDDKTHTTYCCTVIRILHENGTLYTDNSRNKQAITQHRAGHHSSVLFRHFSP